MFVNVLTLYTSRNQNYDLGNVIVYGELLVLIKLSY